MRYRLTVRPQAEKDLIEVQQWYELQRAGLGNDFRATIDDLFQRLATSPLMYPVVYRGLRRVVLRRFPYLIYFLAASSTVTVVACLHTKRNPRLLRGRVS